MKKTGRTRTGGSAARLTRMQDCRAGRAKPGCGAKGGNASHQLRKGERPGGEKGWMDKGKARRRNEERSTVGRERSTATRRGDCGRDPAERRRGSQRRALGNKRMGFPLVGKAPAEGHTFEGRTISGGQGRPGGGGNTANPIAGPGRIGGSEKGKERKREREGKFSVLGRFCVAGATNFLQPRRGHQARVRPREGRRRAG